jgi:DNA-binding NarL/FixJ family response regulator
MSADIKVLIADDQKIVREGLVSLISLLPGIIVVGAATDGDDAVRQALELEPDVVLMDLNMPRCNGVEATEQLRRLRPQARVVVLTTYSDDSWVFSALQAGARDEILRAISDVAAGHAQLDPAVQRRLLDALTAPGSVPGSAPATASVAPGAAAPEGAEPPEGLTPREAEVLAHIAAGESNAEIAAALFVSEATVKTHINHIFGKTGLRDRAQLVGYAFRTGLAFPG